MTRSLTRQLDTMVLLQAQPAPRSFDYSTLSPEVADAARRAADPDARQEVRRLAEAASFHIKAKLLAALAGEGSEP